MTFVHRPDQDGIGAASEAGGEGRGFSAAAELREAVRTLDVLAGVLIS
jgi:hypothetical protein